MNPSLDPYDVSFRISSIQGFGGLRGSCPRCRAWGDAFGGFNPWGCGFTSPKHEIGRSGSAPRSNIGAITISIGFCGVIMVKLQRDHKGT